jgi:hypothetical protein
MTQTALWLARSLIGLVFLSNVQCGIVFLWTPALFVQGFEVQGVGGETLVRGLGLLFLMWSVPYAVAAWHPVQQRTALLEAIGMQALGLLGESYLLWLLPKGRVGAPDHLMLQLTALRFIAFDAAGLLFLLLALRLCLSATSLSKHPLP